MCSQHGPSRPCLSHNHIQLEVQGAFLSLPLFFAYDRHICPESTSLPTFLKHCQDSEDPGLSSGKIPSVDVNAGCLDAVSTWVILKNTHGHVPGYLTLIPLGLLCSWKNERRECITSDTLERRSPLSGGRAASDSVTSQPLRLRASPHQSYSSGREEGAGTKGLLTLTVI